MSGFRSPKWDPWLIVSQMLAVQALYYLGLGFWVVLMTTVLGVTPKLDYLFSYEVSRQLALPLTHARRSPRYFNCRTGAADGSPVCSYSTQSPGKRRRVAFVEPVLSRLILAVLQSSTLSVDTSSAWTSP